MALRQTLETSIGRVIFAIFGTLPPLSAILQINNAVEFHMARKHLAVSIYDENFIRLT